MIRAEFIAYLTTDVGCVIVRNDKTGYTVIRNVINGNISGVPVNDPLKPATVCRICKTLGVDIPAIDEVVAAQAVVEALHRHHNGNS